MIGTDARKVKSLAERRGIATLAAFYRVTILQLRVSQYELRAAADMRLALS
jgi:hypothetical protein